MDIISISRILGSEGIPDTFTVGSNPWAGKQQIEGPSVSKIKYFATSTVYDRIHRNSIYIVEFENSTVKRIIPAKYVLDVAVETEKKEEKFPALPE